MEIIEKGGKYYLAEEIPADEIDMTIKNFEGNKIREQQKLDTINNKILELTRNIDTLKNKDGK